MSRDLVLAVASAVVLLGAVVVFLRDLRMGWEAASGSSQRRVATGKGRVIVEAALPLVGVIALVFWAWIAL